MLHWSHWSYAAAFELSQRVFWLRRAKAAEMRAFTERSGNRTLDTLILAMARLESRDQWIALGFVCAVRAN